MLNVHVKQIASICVIPEANRNDIRGCRRLGGHRSEFLKALLEIPDSVLVHNQFIEQREVTPIDTVVTAATAVGQWSTVNATQTVQSMSGSEIRSTVGTQCKNYTN